MFNATFNNISAISWLSCFIGGVMCMTIGRCVVYRNDLRGILTFDLKVT